ncbi:hypothetical protein B0H34DRAFT_798130 [Crassisporium funariophilum]|nr:hypothetical protein B0H34DRAFT_798130 [Crassisporium funariophilum]
MVSRTTYNTHANARRGPIGSYTDFVDEQSQTIGGVSGGGGAPSDDLRGQSLSVSPLPSGSSRKRLRASPDSDTQPNNNWRAWNRSQSAKSEHGKHNIKQEDLGESQQDFGGGNGHMPPLFGNARGCLATPMDLDENHNEFDRTADIQQPDPGSLDDIQQHEEPEPQHENFPPPPIPGPGENHDVYEVPEVQATLEELKVVQQFIECIRNASLDADSLPTEVIERLRDPPTTVSDLDNQEALQTAIELFIAA